MNLVRVINQVNICHSNLDPGCELAGGELVVGSSERIFSHRLPEGGSLPPPSLHRSHQASHCSSASLWGVIAVRRYQPRLTHTHTASVSHWTVKLVQHQTMAGLHIEQQQSGGCSLDMYWKRGLHTPDDKHTHTGRWLLCSGDTDAGRLEAAPMGRLGLCGTLPQWRKAAVDTVGKSLDGQLPAASWLCLGQPQISSCCL